MTIREFIRKHRAEIDDHVRSQPGARKPRNDEEREDWVFNDETLYNWARREGIKV